MILLYKDLVNKNYSDYQIKKLLKEEKLYMVKKGVYSTTKEYNELECISKKHPNAVFTLETACYCYGLYKKNQIPYVIATKQKDRKIKEDNIKQIFVSDNLYNLGISKVTYQGFKILIYDLERLLIDVVRNKINMDYDHYNEIINNYKKIGKLLNNNKLENYLKEFKDKRIEERIKKEVKGIVK